MKYMFTEFNGEEKSFILSQAEAFISSEYKDLLDYLTYAARMIVEVEGEEIVIMPDSFEERKSAYLELLKRRIFTGDSDSDSDSELFEEEIDKIEDILCIVEDTLDDVLWSLKDIY